MADWFFNISHPVSLQMLKGEITSLNGLAGNSVTVVQFQEQAQGWVVGKETSQVGTHSKAIIKLIPNIKHGSLRVKMTSSWGQQACNYHYYGYFQWLKSE